MQDKLLAIKDEVIDRVKNVSLVRGIEIASGIAVALGAILINFLSEDELVATDIIESYEPNDVEIDYEVEEASTDTE